MRAIGAFVLLSGCPETPPPPPPPVPIVEPVPRANVAPATPAPATSAPVTADPTTAAPTTASPATSRPRTLRPGIERNSGTTPEEAMEKMQKGPTPR